MEMSNEYRKGMADFISEYIDVKKRQEIRGRYCYKSLCKNADNRKSVYG